MCVLGSLNNELSTTMRRIISMRDVTNFSLQAVLLVYLLLGLFSSTHALNANILENWVRKATHVGDDISVRAIDDVAEQLKKSGSARKSIDDNFRQSGKRVDDMSPAERGRARDAFIISQLRKGIGDNPAVIKQIDSLDDAAKEAALVLVKGGQNIAHKIPDIAMRGKLIRNGGADLVAASGLYGDEFVTNSFRFQSMLDAGSLVVPAGMRMVNLSDFTATLTRYGRGSITFFNSYIKPYWKRWVSSGLLTWWVVNPEHFQTTTGELIQSGVSAVMELAGEMAGAIIAGGIIGSSEAVRNFWQKIADAVSEQGIAGVFVLLVLIFGISLFFKRGRYYVLMPFRWLNR